MTKMKFHFILAVCALFGAESIAQLNFNLNSGYGSFLMSDLKNLQQRISLGYPVQLKNTANYPSYFNFGGGINYEMTKTFRLGANVEYGSSGTRSDYHDYSGYIQVDQMAHYWRISGSIAFTKYIIKDRFIIEFDFRPGTTYTNLDIIARAEVGSSNDYSQQNFTSSNWGLQPTVTLYRIIKDFKVYTFAGYNLTAFKGRLYYSGRKDVYLQNGGNEAYADWGGYRIGIGINYRFQF